MTYINYSPGGYKLGDNVGTPLPPEDMPDILDNPNGWVHAVRMRDIEETWATVMHPDAYEEARREVRRERHIAALQKRKNRNV